MARKRTTLLLEPSLVRAARRALGTKTVTETVDVSLREVLRDRLQEQLRRRLGTFHIDLDLQGLRRLRRHG